MSPNLCQHNENRCIQNLHNVSVNLGHLPVTSMKASHLLQYIGYNALGSTICAGTCKIWIMTQLDVICIALAPL